MFSYIIELENGQKMEFKATSDDNAKHIARFLVKDKKYRVWKMPVISSNVIKVDFKKRKRISD